MSDDFDDFTTALQNEIYEETRKAYGDVAFERWLKPLYVGVMDNADGYSRITGSCGDTMEIFLKFQDGKVKDASFQTDGCGSSTICGSFAVELAIGKSLDEVTEITGETILKLFGCFPKEDRHCAFLAAEALQEALNNYMIKEVHQNAKREWNRTNGSGTRNRQRHG